MDGDITATGSLPAIREASNAKIFALAFAGLALICVIIGSYYVYEQIIQQPPIAILMEKYIPTATTVGSDAGNIFVVQSVITFIERYVPLLLIAVFAMSFMRASISFVKSGEYSRTGVVPPRDLPIIEEAIKQGKPEPVDQYIRLASLTGFVGLFQKIGLTGLPLTTLALVAFFASGVMWFDDNTETFKAFLDFTKLTLGAFIGSFVQRQVERRGQEGDIQRAIQTVAQTQQPPPAPVAQ